MLFHVQYIIFERIYCVFLERKICTDSNMSDYFVHDQAVWICKEEKYYPGIIINPKRKIDIKPRLLDERSPMKPGHFYVLWLGTGAVTKVPLALFH